MDKEEKNDNIYLNRLNEEFKRKFGMSYDEFELLDCDEQEKLIEKLRRKKKFKSKMVTVMIGSGENALFVKKKRGERYMLFDGTIVRAGVSPEQERARLEDRYDDIVYNKPVAFVKKMVRRIKNR